MKLDTPECSKKNEGPTLTLPDPFRIPILFLFLILSPCDLS